MIITWNENIVHIENFVRKGKNLSRKKVQPICSGIFPAKLKRAKIIPIFKH